MGPKISLVVALRTTKDNPWPEMKYFIAWSLSSNDWPPVPATASNIDMVWSRQVLIITNFWAVNTA